MPTTGDGLVGASPPGRGDDVPGIRRNLLKDQVRKEVPNLRHTQGDDVRPGRRPFFRGRCSIAQRCPAAGTTASRRIGRSANTR